MDFNKTIINFKFPIEEKEIKYEEESFYGFAAPVTHRFLMSFTSPNGLEEWYVTSVNRPNMVMERTTIDNSLGQNYIPIRHRWQPMEITLWEQVGENMGNTYGLNDWLHSEEKKDIKIEKLDPTGVVVETWLLIGTIITEMPLTPVLHNNNERITMTILFDSCQLMF